MLNRFKHSLLPIALLTSTLLAACGPSAQQSLQNFRPNPQTPMFQRQTTGVRSGDWFASLRPELQQYYAPARGKTGRELMLALNQIISTGQWSPSYQEAKSFLYATADNLTIQNTPGLYDAYSYAFVPGSGGNGNIYKEPGDANADGLPNDFINAEHTWPQSFFKEQMPMVADMHHIFPTLSKPNGMRSNHPIGMVEGTVVYTTSGGAKLSARDKTGRHNPEQVKVWFNLPYQQQPHDVLRNDFKVTFEPPDRHKGNTARALLYFYLRYHKQNIRQGAYNEVDFWDSKVPTFLQWASVDVPDELELKRHELVSQRQRNRNPFIDIPNLGQLIGPEPLVN